MTDAPWDPETYLATMLDEIPGYLELEQQVVAAAADAEPGDVLELGVGTGETARRLLALCPQARWTGIDASEPMLARARERLPGADLRHARLEEPLPAGPFDLVVSALAVHHLDGPDKRALFRRVADVLRPGGRFVLGDLVVPADPADARVEVDWVYDLPSSAPEQLEWLGEAGFAARVTWSDHDLAVLRADL